ncbi:hypothetical protein [Prochlorococcus sp. MIT 1307]|uniref:hypothetical protein n=1 Tax=Prochlorococcus sp. MIT 1307 TaxID=3096219 RepID=UPI002A74EAE0|nr:hypothetical protein [Prochlorococcus sp. MIT 1307]
MKLKTLGVQILLGIALFDISGAIFGRQKVRLLYGRYLNPRDGIGRGYPRYHHKANVERGFDIRPSSSKILAKSKPTEYKAYYVWGNSLGCFDFEDSKESQYDIYLAGDSFTWGYAPLDKKFGTIIEKSTQLRVAKCGVTHTGQGHQFSKFKDIKNKLGYSPKIVIVSVYHNDVINDFMYPKTTVMEGYQVDFKKIVNKKIIIIPSKEIEARFKTWMTSQTHEKILYRRITSLKYWSASFIVLDHSIQKIKAIFFDKNSKQPSYGHSDFDLDSYKTSNPIARSNMMFIKQWIEHSRKNNYKLIFSTIPDRASTSKTYEGFHLYVESLNGLSWDFAEYIEMNHAKKNIFWKNDPHFNIEGNRLYAEYLKKKLSKYDKKNESGLY